MKTPSGLHCFGTTGIGTGLKGEAAVALSFQILIALLFLEKGSMAGVHIMDQSCMLLETTSTII